MSLLGSEHSLTSIDPLLDQQLIADCSSKRKIVSQKFVTTQIDKIMEKLSEQPNQSWDRTHRTFRFLAYRRPISLLSIALLSICKVLYHTVQILC
jgi:hypothetical protein